MPTPDAPQPPVPTPQISVRLVDQPISLDELWGQIADEDCGAQLVFVGRTRRHTQSDETVAVTTELSYEAFRPMAVKELEKLLAEAAEKWPLRHLLGVHRLGDVPVGQASVAIALASPHRDACMQAMPWIMDQLKTRVPVWKQERFEDGSSEWIHP
ncbi:molybdenum cofactor biosynthesis protein MoaE [Roseimaritima ulvae]|uniref:Molybdopterin synthase catalytic subunit n=1 Tax=Roseimaritima ulvae TaxID=980254 RepID=A0A5B9QKQ0_9BACT|nr:molybdenum cofactor biosynthesis protein MoaE [Roseimaritima ulvae]QEG39687.1 Molybdopterin synthase catalytic subunit [Roseimaritima ulvae]